jgi:lysophospholipase L1-like esterase
MRYLGPLIVLVGVGLPTSAWAQLVPEYEPVRHACCQSLNIRNLADQLQDWNQLSRYHLENEELRKKPADPRRVVFMGDSITELWPLAEAFPGQPYVNRGISGQTTSQMLVRMFPDVIALKPAAVVILAGTNDISRATGAVTAEMVKFNLQAMAQLASANGIKVVLASILPTDDTPVRPEGATTGRGGPPQPQGLRTPPVRRKNSEMRPPSDIAALNAWMKEYAKAAGFTYLDYHSATVDAEGMLRDGLSTDGVHPTPAGYAVMAPLVSAALQSVLR